VALECTNSVCDSAATKIIAWDMSGPAVFVAPYCDDHAEEVEVEQGGAPACGPALSDDAQQIEGRR
jgi:hypothetical protein